MHDQVKSEDIKHFLTDTSILSSVNALGVCVHGHVMLGSTQKNISVAEFNFFFFFTCMPSLHLSFFPLFV